MRPISGWLHLMSSTVLVAEKTGQTETGAPTYGADVAYKAHISRKRRLVPDAHGQLVTSGQSIHLGARVLVQPTARVTLSVADVGSTEAYALQPKIVAVEPRFDQLGLHHCVLHLE